MCIAIYQPESKVLTKKEFFTCWENNPDGFGMLWIEKGVLASFKELTSKKTAWKEYRNKAIKFVSSPMVLHFRIATHGKIDIPNCHPFFVNDNLAFVHNGIISVESLRTDISDTNIFNETVLKLLPDNFLSNTAICDLLEERTKSSKLVFLDNKGNATIFNEKGGNWYNGMWFSNSSYKQNIYSYEDSFSRYPDYGMYETINKNAKSKTRFFDKLGDEWENEEDKIITKKEDFALVDNCIFCGEQAKLNDNWTCELCAIDSPIEND